MSPPRSRQRAALPGLNPGFNPGLGTPEQNLPELRTSFVNFQVHGVFQQVAVANQYARHIFSAMVGLGMEDSVKETTRDDGTVGVKGVNHKNEAYSDCDVAMVVVRKTPFFGAGAAAPEGSGETFGLPFRAGAGQRIS